MSNAIAKATIVKQGGKFIVRHYSDSVSEQSGIDHCFDEMEEAMLDFYKYNPKGNLAVMPGMIVVFPSRDTMRWQGKHNGFDCHDVGKGAEHRWQGIKQQSEKATMLGGQNLASFLANV